jgi:hypothetical protein
MFDLWEQITRILEGFLRDLAGFDRTVELLESSFQQQPPDRREQFFDLLQSQLFSEAYSYLQSRRTAHQVIIRAWAAFGPADKLPNTLFALLRSNETDGMESWARVIAPEFVHSLLSYRERFSRATLDGIKAHCAVFTYGQSSGLVGTQFPSSLVEVAMRLEKTVDRIDFEAFERTLVGTTKAKSAGDSLPGLLENLGLDRSVAEALKTAQDYLRSSGPFDAKIAGDLLRTAMDVAHRSMVPALEQLYGKPYEGADKDGDRRAFLRTAGLITPAEEKLFSAIYTYISEEATHKLDAQKETILVVERTVTDYLCLLLQRLSDDLKRHSEA